MLCSVELSMKYFIILGPGYIVVEHHRNKTCTKHLTHYTSTLAY